MYDPKTGQIDKVTDEVSAPNGICFSQDYKRLYIADTGNQRIRRIDPRGVITTIAGVGTAGFSGDNGPAKTAQIGFARAVVVDGEGNIYFTDTDNHRVRRIERFLDAPRR